MTYTLNTPWRVDDPDDALDCTPEQVRERIRVYRQAPPAYGQEILEQYITEGLRVARLARGRASLGFSQSLHETAGLRFGGQVQAHQLNFGGLGATNDGAQGASFQTVRDGWMAFWAHHMSYWWGAFSNWPAWAEMFKQYAYRNRAVLDAGYGGVVTTVGDYTNGRWAWSPQYPRGSLQNGYAQAIVNGANAIRALPKESPVSDVPGVPFVAADSRHHTKGRTVDWPDLLIQHHTDGWDSLAWLTTSPNSNVSSTYLLRHDGTIRAQLVRHADTPHTTGRMNPRSISFEWERKWPEQRNVSDTQYRNIGQAWAEIVKAERKRGNPHFQGTPKREQLQPHNAYYSTTCPGNLDMDRVYAEMVKALGDTKSEPAPAIPKTQPDPWGTKYWIPDVFVADIRKHDWMLTGYAKSEAFSEDGKVVQYFERARLELQPDGTVTRGLVGTEAMESRYPERGAA